MLEEAAQSLHQTEEQAIDIQSNLDSQRQTILKIKSNLGEGNTLLNRMGRVISRMRRRQAFMCAMYLCVIILILGAIGVVIWLSVTDGGKK